MFDAKIVDVGLNTPKCWEMKKFFFGVLEKLCCFDLFPSGRQPRRRIWGVAALQINSQRLTLAASKSELEWLGKKGHRVAYFPAMLCPWLGIRLWPDSSVNYLTGWRFLTFGLWKLENITTSSSAHCLDSSRNTGFRLGSGQRNVSTFVLRETWNVTLSCDFHSLNASKLNWIGWMNWHFHQRRDLPALNGRPPLKVWRRSKHALGLFKIVVLSTLFCTLSGIQSHTNGASRHPHAHKIASIDYWSTKTTKAYNMYTIINTSRCFHCDLEYLILSPFRPPWKQAGGT